MRGFSRFNDLKSLTQHSLPTNTATSSRLEHASADPVRQPTTRYSEVPSVCSGSDSAMCSYSMPSFSSGPTVGWASCLTQWRHGYLVEHVTLRALNGKRTADLPKLTGIATRPSLPFVPATALDCGGTDADWHTVRLTILRSFS